MTTGLSATEVAERLGVEVATVYAYASRGSLTRRAGPDGRRSRYDADEVELLARKGRPRSVRRRPGAVDVVIGTTVSEIGDGWIRYRGIDLLELAGHRPYEHVAHLLWNGRLPARAVDPGWPLDHADQADQATRTRGWRQDRVPSADRRGEVEAAAARAAAALPDDAPVSSRLAAGAAAAAPLLPRGEASDPSAVAGLLIDALVAALPPVSGRPAAPKPRAASVAGRLWPRISPLAPSRTRVAALDLALVLLAEHELATSTLAVRVAASTRAGPAEAVLAGLATVSGPLHGRAAVRVHERLVTGSGPRRTGPTAPHADGFGHLVHRHGDPRFAPLHVAVSGLAGRARQAQIDRDLTAHAEAGNPPPNVDAALGALGYVARAEPGATEAVFAIARVAGWLAHAFEEADEPPLRYRGRTLYRGPR